jgi:hypothetical protein
MANSTFLFIGVLVACLVIFFFFFLRKPKVVVVQQMDPMACCPPCGRGIRFFDYMEDMLSGDTRLYHEFMELKGMWDCDGPKKPFINDDVRKGLQSLVIPNRIRVRLVDSGECLCMRIGLKDRRTYLETPEGDRRYTVLLKDMHQAECLSDILWLDRSIIQSLLDASQAFSLVDEDGRPVNAKIQVDVDAFLKLRDALDQLQYLLEEFVQNTYK